MRKEDSTDLGKLSSESLTSTGWDALVIFAGEVKVGCALFPRGPCSESVMFNVVTLGGKPFK